jgi:hypothetical protein
LVKFIDMKIPTKVPLLDNKCKYIEVYAIRERESVSFNIIVLFSSVYVSYGGLLMCLEGDYRHLQNLTVGENIYLLMRK